MSYLLDGKVTVKKIGQVQIRELNAAGQRQMIKAHAEADMILAMAWAVKYGTVQFRENTPDEIMETLSLDQMQTIAEAVSDLSGLTEDPEKNSVSGLKDASFSD